jgi:hypothetical protein
MRWPHYLTCTHCGVKFSVSWSQGYPGGTQAPGLAILIGFWSLIAGFIFLALAQVFTTLQTLFGFLSFVGFLSAVMLFYSIPEAYRLCRDQGGGKCPECGTPHTVKFWHL